MPNISTRSQSKKLLSQGLVLSLCLLFLAGQAGAESLVLAQISDRPKKDYGQLRPMVEYLASRMQDLGVTGAEVRLYPDLPTLLKGLRAGEVHWITETPYTAAYLMNEAQAVPILRKWKKGQHQYSSLIFTRTDSGIHSLADLKGQTIAFEHPSSFTSYYLPRMLLEQQGLEMQQLQRLDQRPDSDKVGYLFSRNEKNNVLWVHKNLTQAGSLNDGDWEERDRVPPHLLPDLRILQRSAPFPRALELVAADIDPRWAERIRAVLLDMRTDNHRQLLRRYEKSTGFAPLNDQDRALLDAIYQSSQAW